MTQKPITSDLFSMFDSGWGGSNLFCSVPVWLMSILIILLSFSFVSFYYDISYFEVMMSAAADTIFEAISDKAKIFSGLGHIISSLFLVLLPLCVMGYLPMSFSLGAQIFVTTSLSFPFFFMTVGMGLSPSWYLGVVKTVNDGSSFPIKFLVVISELVGLALRPFTLAIRMSLNLAVGSVMLKLFTSFSAGLFFPFTYSIFSLGGPILLGLGFGVFSVLFSFFELCMAVVQSVVFIVLVISYCGDVVIKPE